MENWKLLVIYPETLLTLTDQTVRTSDVEIDILFQTDIRISVRVELHLF